MAVRGTGRQIERSEFKVCDSFLAKMLTTQPKAFCVIELVKTAQEAFRYEYGIEPWNLK